MSYFPGTPELPSKVPRFTSQRSRVTSQETCQHICLWWERLTWEKRKNVWRNSRIQKFNVTEKIKTMTNEEKHIVYKNPDMWHVTIVGGGGTEIFEFLLLLYWIKLSIQITTFGIPGWFRECSIISLKKYKTWIYRNTIHNTLLLLSQSVFIIDSIMKTDNVINNRV